MLSYQDWESLPMKGVLAALNVGSMKLCGSGVSTEAALVEPTALAADL